jgi:hypothetical protein
MIDMTGLLLDKLYIVFREPRTGNQFGPTVARNLPQYCQNVVVSSSSSGKLTGRHVDE